MRHKLAVALIGGSLLALPAQASPDAEAELAEALEGRVAGEAVDCIDLRQVRSSRVIDGTAIIYRVGNVLYVNRPRNGADSLDDHSMMVTRTHGRLCSIDVVELRDRSVPHIMSGLVFLGEFVPYRRIETAATN